MGDDVPIQSSVDIAPDLDMTSGGDMSNSSNGKNKVRKKWYHIILAFFHPHADHQEKETGLCYSSLLIRFETKKKRKRKRERER